jgi:hypothetical protein
MSNDALHSCAYDSNRSNRTNKTYGTYITEQSLFLGLGISVFCVVMSGSESYWRTEHPHGLSAASQMGDCA